MARSKKLSKPEPETLTAVIEKMEQTYFIAEDREWTMPVRDEAIIGIVGRIVEISPRLKGQLGARIDISLVCARSYAREQSTPPTGHPFLLPIQLRKNQRLMMAYLPADAFRSLAPLIRSRAITHVEVRFRPLQRGSAELLSINLTPVPERALAI